MARIKITICQQKTQDTIVRHHTHMQKRNTPQVLILASARGSIIYADLDAPWMWWLGAANIRSLCSLRAFFTGAAAWRRFVLRRALAGAPAGTTTESSWGDELGIGLGSA